MKNKNQKNILLAMAMGIISVATVFSQATNIGNGWGANRFLGWDFSNGANPLTIRTNNLTRMSINGLWSAYGVNTSGFIGIGTSNPAAPLHIVGQEQQAAVGWRRGITLSNSASLAWDGNGGEGYIMAHPSSTPNGNFYSGVLSNLNVNSPVNYAYQVYVNQLFGNNPQASTQFFKNVLVYEQNYGRRFGVNTLNPQQTAEIYSNSNQMRLSYGTSAFANVSTIPTIFTDFFTNSNGNLQIMPSGSRVGINLSSNPTANLDVNGNARIRNVQAATPNSILVGVNANGASDVNVRRLDFNGNANTFLAGNGTFQTINTTPPPANNGVSRLTLFGAPPNAPYQLGDDYAAISFTNTPLTIDRQVRLNGKSFVFSGSGSVGIGLNYPDMPTEVLDANGNGRFRNVPAQGGQSLILGLQNGANSNDVELSRLALPNDNTQVLLGDGTWGTAPSGGLGNYCGASSNPLTGDYTISLNDHNFYYENGANPTTDNRVGVGYVCNDPLPAKLNAQSFGGAVNWAVWGYADGGTSNIGGNFRTYGGTTSYGVYAAAGGATTNYGIMATAPTGTGQYAGYFSGDVFVNGGTNSGTGYLVWNSKQKVDKNLLTLSRIF